MLDNILMGSVFKQSCSSNKWVEAGESEDKLGQRVMNPRRQVAKVFGETRRILFYDSAYLIRMKMSYMPVKFLTRCYDLMLYEKTIKNDQKGIECRTLNNYLVCLEITLGMEECRFHQVKLLFRKMYRPLFFVHSPVCCSLTFVQSPWFGAVFSIPLNSSQFFVSGATSVFWNVCLFSPFDLNIYFLLRMS